MDGPPAAATAARVSGRGAEETGWATGDGARLSLARGSLASPPPSLLFSSSPLLSTLHSGFSAVDCCRQRPRNWIPAAAGQPGSRRVHLSALPCPATSEDGALREERRGRGLCLFIRSADRVPLLPSLPFPSQKYKRTRVLRGTSAQRRWMHLGVMKNKNRKELKEKRKERGAMSRIRLPRSSLFSRSSSPSLLVLCERWIDEEGHFPPSLSPKPYSRTPPDRSPPTGLPSFRSLSPFYDSSVS